MKILIIDDDTIFREDLCEWLGHQGYETFGASDGLMGVSEALRLKPDLVICDLLAPNIDGFEVRVALSKNSETAVIPLMFLTDYSLIDVMKVGSTPDFVITKSSSYLELLEMIRMALL
jgi:DNA-binding response OmpR family regulator